MQFQYQTLAHQLLEKIYSGQLVPHQKLMSLRNFAQKHQVSLTTAKACYELLEAKGAIFVKPKSGYFVQSLNTDMAFPNYPDFKSHPRLISNVTLQNAILNDSIQANKVRLGAVQLSPQLIPTEMLRRSLQRALKHSSPEDFLYNDKQGHLKIRQALAQHYAEDGLFIEADSIFITSGCMPALFSVIQLLTQSGDSVIVPMPNYNGQQVLLASLGRKIIEVPASHQGIDLERLEYVMAQGHSKVCLLTANFQNPLGFCLSNHDKQKIVELATRYQCYIIEDDIYGECGYHPNRPLPLQYWDQAGYIFLCSSISKSVSPAYRIGWLCLPKQHNNLKEELLSLLSVVSTPLQLGLADFIHSRAYRTHLQKLRPQLMQQMADYREFIRQQFQHIEIKLTHPAGGYSLWLQLPHHIDSLEIYQYAKTQNINIVPGEVFGEDQKYANCIRLNVGYPLDDDIRHAIILLKDWIKAQTHI